MIKNFNGEEKIETPTSIKGNVKMLNVCKKLNLHYAEIYEYNGYGYAIADRIVSAENYAIIEANLKPVKAPKKEANPAETWAKRLVKFIEGLTIEEAMEIANEKIEYKNEKIEQMNDKQVERFSQKRATLIRQMERENPLRRITDADHAQSIIEASKRHNTTNYEALLEQARELRKYGEDINTKEYARNNFQRI